MVIKYDVRYSNEPVKYDKYRIKIEWYKGVCDGNEIMSHKPDEIIVSDVMSIIQNNPEAVTPALIKSFENMLLMLKDKMDKNKSVKGDE